MNYDTAMARIAASRLPGLLKVFFEPILMLIAWPLAAVLLGLPARADYGELAWASAGSCAPRPMKGQ